MPVRLVLTIWLSLAAACAPVPAPASPESTLATKTLTFSILEDYDKGDDLADVARDFELFRELNVTTWRGSFGWDDYEPDRGQYDFAWLHSFMALAQQHGVSLRPYIGYTGLGCRRPGSRWSGVESAAARSAGVVRVRKGAVG